MLTAANPFLNPGSGGFRMPSIRWDARNAKLSACDAGMLTGDEVPAGSGIAIDIGTVEAGGVAFNSQQFGKYREFLAPVGQTLDIPNHEDVKSAAKLYVAVQGFDGRRAWLLTGTILMNAVSDAIKLASFRREAAEGAIPVFLYIGAKNVSTIYGDFGAILLRLSHFVPRSDDLWGPRTVAPPKAALSAAEARAALSAPTEPTDAAALTPATDTLFAKPGEVLPPPAAAPAAAKPAPVVKAASTPEPTPKPEPVAATKNGKPAGFKPFGKKPY